MNLYLDDDSVNGLLVRLLQAEGHNVQIPSIVGMAGKKDPTHFFYSIRNARVLLTHNHDDFKVLHELVIHVGGHHPGVLVVRKDNNPKRDLKPAGIVRALRNLLRVAIPLADNFLVLNHWR